MTVISVQANRCHPLLPGDLTRCKQDEVRRTVPKLGISEFVLAVAWGFEDMFGFILTSTVAHLKELRESVMTFNPGGKESEGSVCSVVKSHDLKKG